MLKAYGGSLVALLSFAIPAAWQQHRHSPRHPAPGARAPAPPDWTRIGIVGTMLLAAVATNALAGAAGGAWAANLPLIAVALWIPLLLAAPLRRPDWEHLPSALRGALFLAALVLLASMMPVEHLAPPSWRSVLGLGALSAVFDNIPLTALALQQGGYDWGVLAYAVGFGGSMLWFGSSAGVALSNVHPQIRSINDWVGSGWPIMVAYLAGFAVLLLTHGWHPSGA